MWYSFWWRHWKYICWHFWTKGANGDLGFVYTHDKLLLRDISAASKMISCSTNGFAIDDTAQIQNCCKYCAPSFLEMESNHFTSSPYGGFRANLACGRSSCTLRAKVSIASIPTRYAARRYFILIADCPCWCWFPPSLPPCKNFKITRISVYYVYQITVKWMLVVLIEH